MLTISENSSSQIYFSDLKVGTVFKVVDLGLYIKIHPALNPAGVMYNAVDLNSYESVCFASSTQVIPAQSSELRINWR